MSFAWPDPCLNVVLVEPEIPPNTGNIARTCAATGTRLHLVEPLGFSIEDKHLKRAGLDYWPHVDLRVHPDLETCLSQVPTPSDPSHPVADSDRLHLATARQPVPDSNPAPGWSRSERPNPVPGWGRSAQVWWFSKKATRLVYSAEFRPGDWLVFGPETRGLSDAQLARAGNNLLALPMRGDAVRSLNLGTSAGIALYEALRQCQ